MTKLEDIQKQLEFYNKTDTPRDRLYMRRLLAEGKGILEGIEIVEKLIIDLDKNVKLGDDYKYAKIILLAEIKKLKEWKK